MAGPPTPAPLGPVEWARVNTLFHEAAARPAESRSAFLDRECAGADRVRVEIESLLGFLDPASRIESRVADAVSGEAAVLSAALPLGHIGPYRLIAGIGAGGMGAVYLAERHGDGFTQRVAIKLARGPMSPDALRRFRDERRMLASLEHANVARLIDGGTTPEGLPYLVMEYVEGEPIDRYCSRRSLAVAERLDLFRRICDAVTHAHRSLIVHRDLKPSNVLVTADGTPKLLDFGIAKLLDDDHADPLPATQASMRMMTPEYASPEQVRGAPLTIATDVYSLGVLLFELVTGTRPYQFTSRDPAHLAMVISLSEAPRPSTVASPEAARALRGDLDTIVLTALSKDPSRRYATVEQLSDDLRRYRQGRPIQARPATWSYLASRFIVRHRYATAVAAIALVVTTGLGIALGLSARQTARQRDTSERVTALLIDMFTDNDPARAAGNTVTAREILDRGAARVEQGLGEQPGVRAQLQDAIGNVYFALGLWEPAQKHFGHSLDARHEMGDRDSLRTAATMHRLADVLLWRGQATAAATLIDSTLDLRRRHLGEHHPDVAASLGLRARATAALGGAWADIEPHYLQAVAIWRDTLGADNPEAAVALVQIARGRAVEANFAGAEQAARESLEIRRRAFGHSHPLTIESLLTLAQVLHQGGDPAASEPISREVLERRLKLYGNDAHPWVHQAINQLAMVLADQGKLSDAEPLARQASARSRETIGIFTGTASNLRVLGGILEDQGRLADAETAYRESLDIARKASNGEVQVALAEASLARLLALTGRAADARPMAERSVTAFAGRYGARHVQSAPSLTARAVVLAALQRVTEADAAFRDTIAIQRASLPARHPLLMATLAAYGVFLLEHDSPAAAEPILSEAYAAQQSSLPGLHWSNAWTETAYGAVLARLGRADATLAATGLARLTAAFPAEDPRLVQARQLVAKSRAR